MSDNELAAAIFPKVYGSSTMGVKKSILCMIRSPFSSSYNAESSEDSYPIFFSDAL